MAASPAAGLKGTSVPASTSSAASVLLSDKLPYTEEEMAFLVKQLHEFVTPDKGVRDVNTDSFSTGNMGESDEFAASVSSILAPMVEKVLKLAADSYIPIPSCAAVVADLITPSSHKSPRKMFATESSDVAEVYLSGTAEQFAKENEYLVDEVRQMQYKPFTLQRLLEILADPWRYHSSKDGKLRGDMLQAAVLRCVLVTCPLVPSGPSDVI